MNFIIRILLLQFCIISVQCQTVAQQPIKVGFTSIYDFNEMLPDASNQRAWRGEMLLMVLKIESESNQDIELEIKKPDDRINIESFNLAYVLADFSAGSCGTNKAEGNFRKARIPDRAIRINDSKFKPDSTTSFVLLKVEIDESIRRGNYPLSVNVKQNNIDTEVRAEIQVINRKLPAISNMDFKLDFWQFPMSVADYYKNKPWSKDHFGHLEIMFEQLADINQEVITTTIFWDPYNSKVRDASQMMIQIRKNKEGKFIYDYSNFEKYVELAISKGVDEQISVHNIYPWNNNYFYLDETRGKVVTVNTPTNSNQHHEFWKPFLEDFEGYLKSKGWFEKVMFYVDERNVDTTIELAKFIHGINPEYKLGYAGAFHAKLSPYIFDYSIPSNVVMDPKILKRRQQEGKHTTFYTACFDKGANMLMTSDNMDTYFLLMLANVKGYNGKLRWAFNQWIPNIKDNAIYAHVPSGDAHFVYPDNQPSLRYFLIKDALEEVSKANNRNRKSKTKRLLNNHLDPTLIRSEKQRGELVKSMTKNLNE